MATVQHSTASKLKLLEPMSSMVIGNKFLKWKETNCSNEKVSLVVPVGVTLKVDENCFILYWRDSNQKSDYIEISSIKDVRTGRNAHMPKDKHARELLLSGKSNNSIQDKTITIIYGTELSNLQSINFVSVDNIDPVDIAKTWTDFLFKSATHQRMLNLSPWECLIKLRNSLVYGRAVLDEKTKNFKLPIQTIFDALIIHGKQNVETDRQHIQCMLQAIGLPSGKNEMVDENQLTIDKFFQLFLRLVSKEDIEQIFTKYEPKDASKKKLHLTPDQFENFLNKEQRDPGLNELLFPNYSIDKAAQMIQKFEVEESFKKKKQLSPQGLIRYLMDFENEIVDPVKYELSDDMSQPINHYFINSSHNTYLQGHQITGKSDVEMYRVALLSGCRCIELDCHEDDYFDDVVVTHGRTLCTKILFCEVIRTINDYAFKASEYPVLLSFENFCGRRMLEKMAKHLVEILGDKLIYPNDPILEKFQLKPGVMLPSPEDLKYKVLIKFRRKKLEKELSHNITLMPPDLKINLPEMSSVSVESNLELSNLNNNKDHQVPKGDVSDEEKDGINLENNVLTNENIMSFHSSKSLPKLDRQQKLEKDYQMDDLVNYLQPVTFISFEEAQRKNRSFELSSFVETSAYNFLKEKPTEFINYNKRQFSRIYPKATRIASDNFNPQIFWNVGCQLVALNFQTSDLGMHLNLGKFEYNNKSGYLLKPEIMRRIDVNKLFDPFTETPLDGIVASTLNVKIISGIFLQHSRCDNEKRIGQTVTVELFGLPVDSLRGSKAHRVKAVSSNTFNVIYSDSGFTINKIIMPQLALLKISVFDDQNKMIGYRVLPILGLRPGYRYIHLKNDINRSINSFLFIHLKLQDYVPEEYADFANALVNPIGYVMSLAKKEEMLKTLIDENDGSNMLKQESFLDIIKESKESKSPNLLDTPNASYLKRHSMVSPSTLNLYNTANNIKKANKFLSFFGGSNLNIPAIENNSIYNSLTNINKRKSVNCNSFNDLLDIEHKNKNGLNFNYKKNQQSKEFISNNTNKIDININENERVEIDDNISDKAQSNGNSPISSNYFLSPNINSREQTRSTENIFLKPISYNNYEQKRKSHSDINTVCFEKSNLLNFYVNNQKDTESFHILSRSCSISYAAELDFKNFIFSNSSQLNDPNLFEKIDLEKLKKNKAYLHISKYYLKKIERVEKDADKRISDLAQSLSNDLARFHNDVNKSKIKIENNLAKLTRKKIVKKDYTSNSTPNLFSVVLSAQKMENHSDKSNNFEMKESYIREKYVNQMLSVYSEAYNTIKNLKVASIQPLNLRMEKIIHEISEHRMQQLKILSEKDVAIVNKQTHRMIKLKKKITLQNCQSKEEILKLTKIIEKDSVSLAVIENSKIEELLKAKQKLVKQIVDRSLLELDQEKENLQTVYENELFQKLNEKKLQIETLYLRTNVEIKEDQINKSDSNEIITTHL